MEAILRFLDKVKSADDCWVWGAAQSSSGYGVFWLDGKNYNAHWLSHLFFKGEPNGLWVLHTCDNKSCINPAHLYLGTQQDNVNDAVARGRLATGLKHGSKTTRRSYLFDKNPFGKLSKETCLEIRDRLQNGESAYKINSEYGVHFTTIFRARNKANQLLSQLQLKP